MLRGGASCRCCGGCFAPVAAGTAAWRLRPPAPDGQHRTAPVARAPALPPPRSAGGPPPPLAAASPEEPGRTTPPQQPPLSPLPSSAPKIAVAESWVPNRGALPPWTLSGAAAAAPRLPQRFSGEEEELIAERPPRVLTRRHGADEESGGVVRFGTRAGPPLGTPYPMASRPAACAGDTPIASAAELAAAELWAQAPVAPCQLKSRFGSSPGDYPPSILIEAAAEAQLAAEEDEAEAKRRQQQHQQQQPLQQPPSLGRQDNSDQYGDMVSCLPCHCPAPESARPRAIMTIMGLADTPPHSRALPGFQQWQWHGTI